MKYIRASILSFLFFFLLSASHPVFAEQKPMDQTGGKCRTIATGVEYCLLNVSFAPAVTAGRIHVVRIDPAVAKLKLLLASERDRTSRAPALWCRNFGLVAAINAGMYGQDYSTNVGYLRNGSYLQNKRWVKSYKSAFAFDPQRPDLPAAIMIDLDEPDAMNRVQDYRTVIQNLRLIKGNGINVWKKSDKKWSEAAVGMDTSGRVLFIFCGLPYTMWEFNELVKSSGMGVVRMMHMEGGSVAGMSVRSKDLSLDLAGGYETGIKPEDGKNGQWPIPNVIGVQAK